MASNHYTPNGGKNSSGQGWQYDNQNGGQQNASGQGGSQPPKKPGFNIGEWIPIIVLFCIPSGVTQLIAFFWALSKIVNFVKANKAYQEQLKQFGRAAANVTRDVTNAVRKEVYNVKKSSGAYKAGSAADNGVKKQTGGTTVTSGGAKVTYNSAAAKATAKKARKPKGGSGLIAGGTAITAVFAIATLGAGSIFMESLFMGYFFADELIGTIVCALFMCGGLAMLFKGIGNNRRRERFLNYLAYIGTNQEVNLAHMAAAFDVPVRKLRKDLRRMLSEGILPTGYLDLAAGKLFLTEMGYRAPEPEQKKTEEEIKKEEDDILREIRQINDDIPDEVMSAKIDRIEEITAKILAYQKTHPDRSSQLRSFLNYYLPTTLKILRAYAQLDAQGIEGENISAAKARIEGMMDQVVAGFEKQLDKLFQDQAMDISSDVQVLENMLKKDGLSDDSQNMTMTL